MESGISPKIGRGEASKHGILAKRNKKKVVSDHAEFLWGKLNILAG
jgi:hypothetical protein